MVPLCEGTSLGAKWVQRATLLCPGRVLAEWGIHVSKIENALCQEERVPQKHVGMCAHACEYVYVQVCMHTCVLHECVHTCVCMCACVHMHVCMCRGRRSFQGQRSSSELAQAKAHFLC